MHLVDKFTVDLQWFDVNYDYSVVAFWKKYKILTF